jgi:hypothetical protein
MRLPCILIADMLNVLVDPTGVLAPDQPIPASKRRAESSVRLGGIPRHRRFLRRCRMDHRQVSSMHHKRVTCRRPEYCASCTEAWRGIVFRAEPRCCCLLISAYPGRSPYRLTGAGAPPSSSDLSATPAVVTRSAAIRMIVYAMPRRFANQGMAQGVRACQRIIQDVGMVVILSSSSAYCPDLAKPSTSSGMPSRHNRRYRC